MAVHIAVAIFIIILGVAGGLIFLPKFSDWTSQRE